MDPNRCNIVLLLLTLGVCSTTANDYNALLSRLEAQENLIKANNDLVKALTDRVEVLESRETTHLHRIADLETNVYQQQHMIDELNQQLQKLKQPAEPMAGEETLVEKNTSENELTSKLQRRGKSQTLKTMTDRAVQRIRQTGFESPVAFFAMMGQPLLHAGVNQVFNFEYVITNYGFGYNENSGLFTAPVEGIYVFSTTLVSQHHVNAHASFYHNSNQINVMYVSGLEAGYDTTSATIVLHLLKGDIVSVQNGDANASYYGLNHSSFSGFLLSNFSGMQNVLG